MHCRSAQILLLLIGVVSARAPLDAQFAPIDQPSYALTAWGDPNLGGTYVGPQGGSAMCDIHDGMLVLAPMAVGVTRILQSPRRIVIRNQFESHARVIVVSDRPSAGPLQTGETDDALRGWWDGKVLVVQSATPSPRLLVTLTPTAARLAALLRSTERLTRLGDGVLEYSFALEGRGIDSRMWMMTLSLKRTSHLDVITDSQERCRVRAIP